MAYSLGTELIYFGVTTHDWLDSDYQPGYPAFADSDAPKPVQLELDVAASKSSTQSAAKSSNIWQQ